MNVVSLLTATLVLATALFCLRADAGGEHAYALVPAFS